MTHSDFETRMNVRVASWIGVISGAWAVRFLGGQTASYVLTALLLLTAVFSIQDWRKVTNDKESQG